MDADVAHNDTSARVKSQSPEVASTVFAQAVDSSNVLESERNTEPTVQDVASPNYQMRFALGGHKRSVTSLKFSPDGSLLASACV
jgi:WD40 repeat protein